VHASTVHTTCHAHCVNACFTSTSYVRSAAEAHPLFQEVAPGIASPSLHLYLHTAQVAPTPGHFGACGPVSPNPEPCRPAQVAPAPELSAGHLALAAHILNSPLPAIGSLAPSRSAGPSSGSGGGGGDAPTPAEIALLEAWKSRQLSTDSASDEVELGPMIGRGG